MPNRYRVNAAGQLVAENNGTVTRVNMAQSVAKIADALNLLVDVETLATWPGGWDGNLATTSHDCSHRIALRHPHNKSEIWHATRAQGHATFAGAAHEAAEWIRAQEAVEA